MVPTEIFNHRRMNKLCFVTGLLLLTIKYRSAANDTNEENLQLIEEIIPTVENILNFFNNSKDSVNLDGVFGIRVSGEQFQVILDRIKRKCKDEEILQFKKIIDRLEKLQINLEITANDSIYYIKKNQPKYYNISGFLLEKDIWNKHFTSKNTNSSYSYPRRVDSSRLVEKESDKCLKEWTNENCKPSEKCWEKMTSPNHVTYYITHELLYIVVGRLLGCEKEVEKLSQKYKGMSSDDLLNSWCSSILVEVKKESDNGLTTPYQDLFMEQIGVCGLVGFKDFFTAEWTRKIISWQQPSGCYSNHKDSLPNIWHRSKREERVMPGDCLAHKTTLALFSLQQSIRYFLEPILASHCLQWNT